MCFLRTFYYRHCEEVWRSNIFLDFCHFEGGYDWEILRLWVTPIHEITSLHCVRFVMTFEMSVRVILCNAVEQNSIENLVITEYFSIQNSLHCNFRLAFWGRFCYRYCEEVGRSILFLDYCHLEHYRVQNIFWMKIAYEVSWEVSKLWVTLNLWDYVTFHFATARLEMTVFD